MDSDTEAYTLDYDFTKRVNFVEHHIFLIFSLEPAARPLARNLKGKKCTVLSPNSRIAIVRPRVACPVALGWRARRGWAS